MSFFSLAEQGFARVAAITIPVHLGDPLANAAEILGAAQSCHSQGTSLAVFPELSISGYSLDDLLLQTELLNQVEAAIELVRVDSQALRPILLVGAPLRFQGALYNCAVAIHQGRILGITPKTHLPSYREFYEKRYFSVLPPHHGQLWAKWNQRLEPASANTPEAIPFGAFQVRATDLPGFQVAAEICEDLWVPVPPSSVSALQGATVLANLSASPVTVGRARRREDLVKAQSAVTNAAYIYTAAGYGESSNDLSWDGQSLIYEAGACLAQSSRFDMETSITVADVDLQLLEFERRQQNSFSDNATQTVTQFAPVVSITLGDSPEATDAAQLLRPLEQFPFVPADPAQLDSDCYEAFNIQVSALARRIESIGSPKLVIGVSGGLDSTHALLVCARVMDQLGRPRTDILAYTMPGFGTSAQTRSNAQLLCEQLGVSFEELDIRPSAEQMLQTMGHPHSVGEVQYDVTFENVQAGLRTDYLFRLANQFGGIVVGTGDLSELALGWCTYGVGDQMSHYAVNSGLAKTMIQHLIRWVAANADFGSSSDQQSLRLILESILATEISPELVPPGNSGTIQSTQAVIGPYELQDFTLYYLLRHGFTPRRIAFLAAQAWGDKYTMEEILHWLEVFQRRFFANQFKRTAIPNGPKILSGGALSPRGDWRMPSDAVSHAWQEQIRHLREELTDAPVAQTRRTISK